MTLTSVSTMSLGTAMLPTIAQADAQLTQLEAESSTGQYADLGLHLGASSGYELSLRNSDDLLQSITTANAIVGGSLSTASNALTSIVSSARATVSTLLSWVPGSTTSADLGAAGDDSLQSLTALANSSYNDQYVFGGINTGSQPLAAFTANSPAAAALAAAFQTQFGFSLSSSSVSTITSAQMTSFLNGAFDDEFSSANWSANWSSASSVNTTAEIAPGQTVQTSANLNSGGFQPLAQAYAMLSMFGDSALSSSVKQAVVTTATGLLNHGLTQLTGIGAQVGTMQAQVTQADDEMSTQMTLLINQIGGLDNVNAEKVATQLNSLTTQIETAYQITAQLQKLSLAQYLPS